ncbi:LPS export ABC transporter periplasmic protein LptC [Bradyrhizobium sp. LHD-71]|uniref:LPS export ABC transporter periplasmic protein LptC n=1 Tax=Bradyrhizobium sp. LHD-71 TaxID=3072141 RepID=UPI00280F0B8E|nr:LPS export ABC transporter periplasmic protein LptC [Bradyrhizobium sp. LHD-71]MDQ8732246.1 LPS export ABC transporter periplasmic protein LptC [Bradyrhizobium sp. LHD-71]
MHSVRDPVYLAALEQRFASAARHSKLVRILRKAVPAAIVVSMLMIVGVSVFNPFRMLVNLPIDIGNVVVSGTKITMQSPHLAGFTPDRRPYEVTANTAMQDINNPNFIELETLKAKIEMEDKSTVLMDARRGYLKNREQLLDLHDDVVLKSTSYEARLIEATIDIGKGTVVSDKPVNVKMLEGTLDAQRLEITGRGEVMTFHGGVTMHLKPIDRSAQSEAQAAARQ